MSGYFYLPLLVVFTEAATQSIEMILREKSVMMVVYEETIAFGKK
jgi:hypothetical protein